MAYLVEQTRKRQQGYSGPEPEVYYGWFISGNRWAIAEDAYLLSAQEGTKVIALEPEIPPPYLRAEDFPSLAAIWDNDSDTIFDTM